MAKGVEFSSIRIFEGESRRMPIFALHESARAGHDRVLPGRFRNLRIAEAVENVKAGESDNRVERGFGNGKPRSFEHTYGMNNPMAYFAETAEA